MKNFSEVAMKTKGQRCSSLSLLFVVLPPARYRLTLDIIDKMDYL